jgi:HAD superfamily hydrolase (TIGR01484 family)
VRPFREFPDVARRQIRYVLTDVDDTLTRHGRLSARTYGALERLHEAGIKVVPITAAPAGWCDQIVRMWPVDGVIGENGGFYFVRAGDGSTVERRYWLPDAERIAALARLDTIAAEVVQGFPDARLARDHGYREITVAIEFAGDAARRRDRGAVRDRLRAAGASATINSLWVLAWLGGFDKLAMARRMMAEVFGRTLEDARDAVLYVGDSINDEPMFGFFPHSVGVATVADFLADMAHPPRWVTDGPGGDGFVEVADRLLAGR